MTITLHCTHCNQSMAIAPRKPGSRVDCPSCGRSVVVPTADTVEKQLSPAAVCEAATASSRSADLLPAGADRGGAVATATPRARTATDPTVSATAAATPKAATAPRSHKPMPTLAEPKVPVLPHRAIESVSAQSAGLLERAAAPGGVLLPKSVLVLSIVFALAALAIAFFAGFLFGKQTAAESRKASFNPPPQARAVQNHACGGGFNEASLRWWLDDVSTSSKFPLLGVVPHAC